jgi:hypothetical protein
VAAVLHSLTGGDFVQDSAYRWWPKAREGPEYSGAAPGTFLGRLCRNIMRFWVYQLRDDLAAATARVQAW